MGSTNHYDGSLKDTLGDDGDGDDRDGDVASSMRPVSQSDLLLGYDEERRALINSDEESWTDEDLEAKSNGCQMYMTITKSIVGAGSFALPYCFMNMGLVLGIITLVFFGVVGSWMVLVLVNCKQLVSKKLGRRGVTYVDIARFAYGKWCAVFVYVLVAMASLGVSASYLVFIGDTMNQVEDSLEVIEWKAIALACVIPLTWLRNMKLLSWTSILGNLALLIGLVVTMVYGFQYHMDDFQNFDPVWAAWDTYFDSFGSVAFLFCIHFLVLPIEENARNKRTFWIPLSTAIGIVTVSNIIFGLFGYMFWGEETCSIVLLNMSNDDILVFVIKVAICIDLVFTYAIVFVPGREIVENSLLGPDDSWLETKRNVIRTLLAGVTFVVAQVKGFGAITNLVGIPMSVCAFVLPPLFHMRLHGWRTFSKVRLAAYGALIVFGVFACTITTVYEIISMVENETEDCVQDFFNNTSSSTDADVPLLSPHLF